ITDPKLGDQTVPHEADRRLCPGCSAPLHYDRTFYGHLGDYDCPTCGWLRPDANLSLQHVQRDASGGFRLSISHEGGQSELNLRLAGLYNAYNALAALAVTSALGIPVPDAVAALGTFQGVFGRQERIEIGAGDLSLTL